MALQDDVAIKYSVYTLFCRRVMENIQALERAVEGDLNLSMDECLQRFGVWLKEFFNQETSTATEASVRLFCQKVTAQANVMRTGQGGGAAAAAIFDQVVSDANGLACSWDFLPEITSYHDQGRDLAQAFFNNLSSSVSPSRLTPRAQLDLEFRGSGTMEQRSSGNIGWGHKVAPIVTFPKENRIVLRFTYEHDFPLYLLYLFLFLHEYTGHIFSNDYGNTLISDGWMIFAADEFLRWHLMKSNSSSSLKPEQVFAFRKYFLGKVSGQPREGYDIAHLFYDWLGKHSGTLLFHAITYELATFTLQPGEEKSWPTKFFQALKNELIRGDRQKLLSKIKAARDIRHLYSMLTPPKPPPF